MDLATANGSDITIRYSAYPSPLEQRPDLTPTQPPGWSDKIVVSNMPGTTIDAQFLEYSDFVFIDWAGTNIGDATPLQEFSAALYLDGASEPVNTWTISPSDADPSDIFTANDFILGRFLTPGDQTLTLFVDYDNRIPEWDETNNTYTKTFTIGRPDLTPIQPSGWSDTIVVSKQSGSHADDSATRKGWRIQWETNPPGQEPKPRSLDGRQEGNRMF